MTGNNFFLLQSISTSPDSSDSVSCSRRLYRHQSHRPSPHRRTPSSSNFVTTRPASTPPSSPSPRRLYAHVHRAPHITRGDAGPAGPESPASSGPDPSAPAAPATTPPDTTNPVPTTSPTSAPATQPPPLPKIQSLRPKSQRARRRQRRALLPHPPRRLSSLDYQQSQPIPIQRYTPRSISGACSDAEQLLHLAVPRGVPKVNHQADDEPDNKADLCRRVG